jgi:hypothetical protein
MNMQCLCASRRQRECEEREGERGREGELARPRCEGAACASRKPQAAKKQTSGNRRWQRRNPAAPEAAHLPTQGGRVHEARRK